MKEIGAKTKLVFVVTKSNWGGAQSYVYDLTTSLRKEEYDISVVLGKPRDDTTESGKGRLYKALESTNVEIIPIKEFQRDINLLEEIIVFFKLIKIFLKIKPDIIHLNSSKASGLGAVAGWITGVKKRIYSVHGWPFNESRNWFSKKLIFFFSWLTVLFSTDVIAVSEETYEQGLVMPIKRDKLTLIHNGVKDIDFRNKNSARQIIKESILTTSNTAPDTDHFWVGTVSELTKNKGLEYLIGAISRINKDHPELKIFCVIIGGGENEEKLRNLITTENLQGKVFLTGFIPNAATLIKAFDVLTLTSIKEGHPLVLLEAGLAKLPVVVSDLKGIRDIVGEDEGIVVEKGDTLKISDSILKLYEEEKNREELAKALNQKVISEFKFENTLAKTRKIYES